MRKRKNIALGCVGVAGAFLFLVALLLVWNDYDVRLWMSRGAMNQFASEVMALSPDAPLPRQRQVGRFRATGIERLPNGVRFYADYGNWFDKNGFEYSTQPLPKRDGRFHYRPDRGGWYWFWDSGMPPATGPNAPRDIEELVPVDQHPA